MDTTDPDIVFDENGVCNHCHAYDMAVKTCVFTGQNGQKRLNDIILQIKKEGKKRDYDCVIGVSGGVDSMYVAYKVKEYGLHPLVIHLDNGWNSELAVNNIEQAIKILDYELYTHVIDWEEFKDLQKAFLYASTPDSEIPSDHAIVSLMYEMAEKIGTNYIIAGANYRTESHLPSAWSQGHMDWRYINSIHKQFGKMELKTFPHLNIIRLKYLRRKIKWFSMLDYIDYEKKGAKEVLKRYLCWKDYGWKHHESIYTRFYQGYILPKKFGYDKRKTHYSSLICSGEVTRSAALQDLSNEPYPLNTQMEDKTYVIKKFNIDEKEFERIMKLPKRSFWDYPSYAKLYKNPHIIELIGLYRNFRRYAIKGSSD